MPRLTQALADVRLRGTRLLLTDDHHEHTTLELRRGSRRRAAAVIPDAPEQHE
jgi:hypothetical protein